MRPALEQMRQASTLSLPPGGDKGLVGGSIRNSLKMLRLASVMLVGVWRGVCSRFGNDLGVVVIVRRHFPPLFEFGQSRGGETASSTSSPRGLDTSYHRERW